MSDFLNIMTDIRDVKYHDIVTKHDTVVAKEALINPHYSAIDIVYANIASVNAVNANEVNIKGVNANKTNIDIVVLNKANIDTTATNDTNITTVATNISAITTNVTNIVAIQNASANALSAIASKEASSISESNAASSASAASSSANSASTSATTATAQANIATQKSDAITGLSAVASSLIAGSTATASYNSTTGALTFGIPVGEQGAKGEQGDSFTVDSQGLIANRGTFDAQPKDFSYFATNESLIYFKNSATSGDWSIGSPFGKGDTGNGIASMVKMSTLGLTDTYRITYTDASFFEYTITNGADGDLIAANNLSELTDIVAAKTKLLLQNVDNTSDADKPISTATQAALDNLATTITEW